MASASVGTTLARSAHVHGGGHGAGEGRAHAHGGSGGPDLRVDWQGTGRE